MQAVMGSKRLVLRPNGHSGLSGFVMSDGTDNKLLKLWYGTTSTSFERLISGEM